MLDLFLTGDDRSEPGRVHEVDASEVEGDVVRSSVEGCVDLIAYRLGVRKIDLPRRLDDYPSVLEVRVYVDDCYGPLIFCRFDTWILSAAPCTGIRARVQSRGKTMHSPAPEPSMVVAGPSPKSTLGQVDGSD